MSPRKETTTTTLVLDALIRANDFLTAQQLQEITQRKYGQVNAALHWLHTRKAINCLHSDGLLWWYATPEDDDRSKTCDERTPETRPRRPHKRKICETID